MACVHRKNTSASDPRMADAASCCLCGGPLMITLATRRLYRRYLGFPGNRWFAWQAGTAAGAPVRLR